MDNTQTLPSSSLWAIPRAVWIGAAAFGIAAASAGAAMWLQPKTASSAVVATPVSPKEAKAMAAKPAPKGAQVAAVPTCQNCGVVESVRTYQRKGEGSGVGAVAGGVVGAVVGNQFGKGNGRSAMTVIGAVGGGVAGNEIEKRSKSVTVTEVRVRMDDGTLRTFEPKVVPNAGDRVVVQGQSLQPAPHQGG